MLIAGSDPLRAFDFEGTLIWEFSDAQMKRAIVVPTATKHEPMETTEDSEYSTTLQVLSMDGVCLWESGIPGWVKGIGGSYDNSLVAFGKSTLIGIDGSLAGPDKIAWKYQDKRFQYREVAVDSSGNIAALECLEHDYRHDSPEYNFWQSHPNLVKLNRQGELVSRQRVNIPRDG